MTENEIANKILGMTLELGEWRVKFDNGKAKISGHYVIKANDKQIARNSFNDGYGSMDLNFSYDLAKESELITDKIKNELQKLLVQ
jgi:hypothetical protein